MLHKLALLSSLLFFPITSDSASQTIAAETQTVAGKYTVTVSDGPLSASVHAQIPVKDGRLFMATWGADHLPEGWATFVRNFQVRDKTNRVVPYESKPNGGWQLSNAFSGIANVSYQIDLSFTKTKWPYGNEQAGSFQDDALFVVTKALFVVSDVQGRRQVTLETPGAWRISTPWQQLNADPRVFVAEDNDDLINNSVVLGKHVEYVFNEGRFTLALALLGSVQKSRDLIAETLQKVVRSYIHIFGDTPRSKYLMTVFYADGSDAEAFAKSAAFTERDAITGNNLIRWGNTLAHEFFHSWNGHAIRAEDYAATQWFSEGFTEYFANLALIQQGLISKDLFVRKMENHFGLYLYFKESPAFDGVTLKEAGSRKGRNRLGVYNGGWVVAFCLDLLIREETKNRKSLADFMRLIYQRFGLEGKKFQYLDLVIAASETAGRNVETFFKSYVEGKELLPVQEYLRRIGFEGYTQFYDGEFYIFDSPAMNSTQKAVRQSILTGR